MLEGVRSRHRIGQSRIENKHPEGKFPSGCDYILQKLLFDWCLAQAAGEQNDCHQDERQDEQAG